MDGYYFFLHYFCPLKSLLAYISPYIGTVVVAVPLLILFIARAIDGITGGNVSIANAYLADLSSDTTRSKNFGKMAISSNLGFILGPALAGILGGTIYGATLPVLLALILSLVTIAVIFFMLKESKPKAEEVLVPEEGTIRKVFSQECKECYSTTDTKKSRLQDVFKLKYIPYLLVLYFLIFLGFNIYYAAFPLMRQRI